MYKTSNEGQLSLAATRRTKEGYKVSFGYNKCSQQGELLLL